jgi:phosphoglycolate phosphatase-like HAD superfamily hydrolase
MITRVHTLTVVFLLAGARVAAAQTTPAADPLPSWNDTAAKQAIVDFVSRVIHEGTADFVPPEERIAVFDNDGTLWAEQPAYFQLLFAVDRIKALGPDHPEWRNTEPYKSVLAGDMQALAAQGEKGIVQIMAVTHSGITTREFNNVAKGWLAAAKHPTTGRLYTDMIYQPMLEVLDYLRANRFKTFIVSGGGVEFMRAFAEQTYGIPPEQVIGSSGKVKFEMREGVPVLVKLPELNFIDDKEGKPVAINQHIGRRPIMAFGNSDGDLQMLQYTTIPRGSDDTTPRFGLIVHHTDAEREWAYDRDSHIGRLDKALDETPRRGWVVVDMKNDWKQIFP